MNTALQVHTPQPTTALATAGATIPEMIRLSEMLVSSGLLPDWIKRPGQALAIILAGQELGMPPMRSLRSFSLVKGKVTENADSQLARFKDAGGRAVFRELTDLRALLWLRHPNGDEHTETFTIEDAKRADLFAQQPNYRKYPTAMLRSRAITAGLKSVGWSGAVGAYDPDEAREIGPVPGMATDAADDASDVEIVDAERPVPAAEPEPAEGARTVDVAKKPASAEQRVRLRALADDRLLPDSVRQGCAALAEDGDLTMGRAGAAIGKAKAKLEEIKGNRSEQPEPAA